MVNPFHCVPDREFATTTEAFEYILAPESGSFAGVLVDVDGVLIDVEQRHPPPEVGSNLSADLLELLWQVDEAYGACIVTNRIRYDYFDPEGLEAVFELPVVTGTKRKPNKEIFYTGMELLGVDTDRAGEVVMVGDSSYFDTYGAGKAGLQTIQVDQDRSKYPLPKQAGKRMADGVQVVFKGLHKLKNGRG